ncbi:MAG: prepilin-type N-terminal cleavage/methylation domain-containing protein [Gemmatimonadetes bacterium]|nr:prepilin-type N-terminal cleavage/methylation domain-containing protein [Gemmatimonadota bacterium]
MRRGFTLLELTGVLTLLALAASLSFPMGRSVRDRLAVTGAREELVGLITRARAEALRRGSSSLIVVQNPTEIRIEASGELLHRVDIGAIWKIELVLSGGRPTVELRFDASGLGRMAASSVTLTRGKAVARLVISAYGRIRRE